MTRAGDVALYCLHCLRHPRKNPVVFFWLTFILILGLVAAVATAGALTASEATITVEERIGAHGVDGIYLCGVEGAEREDSLRKGGGESGAPSSLSRRTGILYAGGGST